LLQVSSVQSVCCERAAAVQSKTSTTGRVGGGGAEPMLSAPASWALIDSDSSGML